jgi:hypothetical protein
MDSSVFSRVRCYILEEMDFGSCMLVGGIDAFTGGIFFDDCDGGVITV